MSVVSLLLELPRWLLQTSFGLSMSLLIYVGIAIASYVSYYLFIRPFFHPLWKIPGMPYNPFIGNARQFFKKTLEINVRGIEQVLKEYGQFFRAQMPLGQIILVVADPDILKHILVTNSKNYIKPRVIVIEIFEKVIGKGLVLLEGPTHAAHKKLISPSFNNASIKKMLPVFEQAGNELAAHWLEQLSKRGSSGRVNVPIQNELSHITMNVIGKTAFGYDFNCLENPNEPVSIAFQNILEAKDLNERMLIPYYFELPFPDVVKVKRDIRAMHSKVSEIINFKKKLFDEGKDVANQTKDILGKMMLARDEDTGEGLSDLELKDEVTTILSAGHETTSTGMAWFLYCMSKYPEVQSKCQEEVLQHLPTPDAPVTWEVLDKLHYLECTIKETLRMYPPVPVTFREALKPDVFKKKYHIPANTHCMIPLAPMMRLPELFEDPDTYNPERFDQSDDENKNMYKFMPFLIGPRMCVGYKFAMLQMKVILACLLRQLHFEEIPGTKFVENYRNRITMRPDPPLELYVLRPRNDEE